jgi:molybdate transport system substrate-binding protein
LGFTSLAELKAKETIPGSYWKVPTDLYKPLEQQAVLLKSGKGNKDAEGFLEYLKTPESQAVIEKYGYGKPATPVAANPAK